MHKEAAAQILESSPPSQAPREQAMHGLGLRFPCGLMDTVNDLEQLEKKAEGSSKSIMITDRAGLITYVNPVFSKLTGFSLLETAGKPVSLLKSGLHEDSFYSQLWNTLNEGREFQAVFANRKKDGEIYFEEKRIRPFVDRDGESKYFVAVSHPVNNLLQGTLMHLERLANHDSLTGLPNRNIFLDRLYQHFSRASRYSTRFALAYVDLDGFKEINDTLGHAAGDAVLQAAAQNIQNVLRKEDTVCRLGGDEFGLILSNTNGEGNLRLTIEKIHEALAKGVIYNGRKIPIRASIGVTRYPEGGCDVDTMIRNADRTMYRCKQSGGSHFLFYEEENQPTPTHQARGRLAEMAACNCSVEAKPKLQGRARLKQK